MFIGREHELVTLKSLLNTRHANLVVIKGRRRIGKSRLINEFARTMRHYVFMGLSPRPGSTAQDQRNEFIRQFKEQFDMPAIYSNDWGEIFSLLAKQTSTGQVAILFDEISWMATGDADFIGKLKVAWDLYFSRNSKLILFLCGSVSAWIEKNILSYTGYLGRPSLHINLRELDLSACNQFWGNNNNAISAFEKLKLLAITGGVPRYLELINPKLTAEDNIRNLCFNTNSPLWDEFKYIFSDIYGSRSAKYQAIVKCLVKSKASREEIIDVLGLANSGDISEYLYELEIGGFIEREHTWNIKTQKLSNLSYYRLKDSYTRFYLKYILPNKAKIEKGLFTNISINNLPGWDTILALQFENLVLNNHNKIIQLLAINPEDIIMANPYFQRAGVRKTGCQIDYLVQTKHDTVYICQIKFSRREITNNIISEVQQKLDRINLPKHISRRTVLIHVNGVQAEVLDADYFTNIIDFSSFLFD